MYHNVAIQRILPMQICFKEMPYINITLARSFGHITSCRGKKIQTKTNSKKHTKKRL